jgi:hypothetical protein
MFPIASKNLTPLASNCLMTLTTKSKITAAAKTKQSTKFKELKHWTTVIIMTIQIKNAMFVPD